LLIQARENKTQENNEEAQRKILMDRFHLQKEARNWSGTMQYRMIINSPCFREVKRIKIDNKSRRNKQAIYTASSTQSCA
jgi:hypothetical protein